MKVPYCVYVFDCDHGVKVGITYDIDSRCADLERGFGTPFRPLRVWHFKSRQGAWEIEQHAHLLLAEWGTYGEWFHCHPLEAVDAVELAMRSTRRDYFSLREELAA